MSALFFTLFSFFFFFFELLSVLSLSLSRGIEPSTLLRGILSLSLSLSCVRRIFCSVTHLSLSGNFSRKHIEQEEEDKKNVRHRPIRRFRRHENRDETALCGRSTRAIVRREVCAFIINSRKQHVSILRILIGPREEFFFFEFTKHF